MKMVRIIKWVAVTILCGILAPCAALASSVCPRPAAQGDVLQPPDLFSSGGKLELSFDYLTTVDTAGRTLFCFQTPDGIESPTLRVNPGDVITIHLTNRVISASAGPTEVVSNHRNQCGDKTMTLSSVNMHFHGMNVTPGCHGDEAIHTIVNSGQTFQYQIRIPKDEPPGLYWYHPHVHGIASPAVQGGATGAIIVGGIENIQPAVAGLPERLVIIRDEPLLNQGALSATHPDDGPMPNWDVSVNYVPVPFPSYPAALIRTTRGTREFWRVANAAANTILDLQVIYDGKPQTMEVVGLDGVPTGSQNGKRQGTIVNEKHILLPPSSRVEFILAMPTSKVAQAYLVTRAIKGGPASDTNPARTLAQIIASDKPTKLRRLSERSGPPNPQRFEDIDHAKVTANRTLYFLEVPGHATKAPAGEPVFFYIVVDGQTPKLFDPNDKPAIVTNKGAVEDWTIQNRTFEVHEFHMHQIHFKVLEENGVPVPRDQQQWRDTYQVGYWDGKGKYPNIKVRMDFRGAVVGDFVYHCHILDHEDGGMMAVIRVKPQKKV
ncbi:MAG: multicopper oxidase family protein [Alphaproteobacteria bacterium]|nr:multicopper oxidase family protein [Alphaproteobacteria bacterium]